MEEILNSEENIHPRKSRSNMEEIIPPFFKNMFEKANLEFDYEINKVKLDTVENLNTKMYIVDRYNPKEMRIVNYNEFKDKLIDLKPLLNPIKDKPKNKFTKAFCLKRLVSKKKRRFEENDFDLDMTYITKRVIAMGFPSTGCESIYRNSLKDILSLFRVKHNNNVKIYNLCVEKERIYKKDLFPFSSVTLFPSKDHNPCPIKLILEFCVDLVLHLINNPCSVAAVHCKAGKGRTGVMICSYLIFSGLCSSAEEAFDYYAKVRTYDNKGVTIPSQRRYVKYFESFLQTNFCKPYVHMIPQMIKYHVQDKTKNILKNFMHDERYFVSPNDFFLNFIKIGPLNKKAELSINICNFVYKPLKINISKRFDQSIDGKDFYFIFVFEEKVKIDSDIKIKISGGLDFYIWVNLWYSTLEIIRQFVDKHHTEKEEDERNKFVEDYKKRKSEMQKNTNLTKNSSDIELKNLVISNKKDGGFSSNNTEFKKDDNKNEKITNNSHFNEDSKIISNYNSNIKPKTLNKDQNNNEDIYFNAENNNQINNNNQIVGKNNNSKELNEVNNESNCLTLGNIDVNNNVNMKGNFKVKNAVEAKERGEFGEKSEKKLIEKNSRAPETNNKMIKVDFCEDEEPDVFQIIDSLDHSTDLNKIISAVNEINIKKKRPLINSEDFLTSLGAFELDKFDAKKKMREDFTMQINFSLYNFK